MFNVDREFYELTAQKLTNLESYIQQYVVSNYNVAQRVFTQNIPGSVNYIIFKITKL